MLVLVDKNRGLCHLDHQLPGKFWHQKCVVKANQDYHHRMELVCISDNSKYFLFCDNFLQTFSVWKHTDMSHEMVKRYLENASSNRPIKIDKVGKSNSSALSRMKNNQHIKDYNTASKPKAEKE